MIYLQARNGEPFPPNMMQATQTDRRTLGHLLADGLSTELSYMTTDEMEGAIALEAELTAAAKESETL